MKERKTDLKKYLNWLKKNNFSTKTVNTYKKTLNKYIDAVSLTCKGIIKFVKQINKKIEPITCKNYLAALNSFAKFKKINIDWNKVKKFIPKVQKKFYVTVDKSELEKLKLVRFEESDWLYKRNNLILDFLFYTGVRVSELINIKYKDLKNNNLKILGKGNKIRYVLLPMFLNQKNNKNNNSKYLFPNNQRRRLHPENVREIIHLRTKLTDIKKTITPHTFRRSLATNLYNKGSRLETIQKQLGHNNIQSTLDYINNDYGTLYQDYSKLWT